jgi:SAM-dependent methyltransferase
MNETLSEIARLSSEWIEQHGATHRGVGYRDEASQPLRFAKLAQIVDPRRAGEGISVNDFGCGYGALFRYLDENLPVPLTRYYGYDISPEVLTAGEQWVADDRAVFEESSRVTHLADYSFVSGTFNMKLDASDDAWTEYIKETLQNLADHSRLGFALNALTIYVDWKDEGQYYADPFYFFDFCKRNISRYVSLLHDYPLFEWTLLVSKDAQVP